MESDFGKENSNTLSSDERNFAYERETYIQTYLKTN